MWISKSPGPGSRPQAIVVAERNTSYGPSSPLMKAPTPLKLRGMTWSPAVRLRSRILKSITPDMPEMEPKTKKKPGRDVLAETFTWMKLKRLLPSVSNPVSVWGGVKANMGPKSTWL